MDNPPAALTRLRQSTALMEVGVLGAALLLVQAAPRHLSFGVYATGAVGGAVLAVHALAVLLVYRSNRVVNFCQVQLASLSAFVFVDVAQGQRLIDVTRSACGCIAAQPGRLAVTVNFFAAAVIGVLVAMVASYLVGQLVTRRFAHAPRIVCSLVTVFAAQVFLGLQPTIERLLLPKPTGTQTMDQLKSVLQTRSTYPPGDFVWRIDPFATFRMGQVLLLLFAGFAVAALSYWLRRTRAGAELRAASERPGRAETLGVDVAAVATRVWLWAGLFAGVVGVVSGFGRDVRTLSAPQIASLELALVLTAVVTGRFRRLGVVALAAAVFGVLQQTVAQGFQSTAPLAAALPLLVGLLLVPQREHPSRAEQEAEAAAALADEVRPVPPELRRLPQVRAWAKAGAVIGAVVVLGLPWALSASTTASAAAFVVLSLVGLSLLVLTGWAGQLSLGQMGVAAVGAWVVAVTGLPAPIAVVVGGLAGAAVSMLMGLPAVRLRNVHVAVISLAFALSAQAVFADRRYLGAHVPRLIARPAVLGMDFNDPRAFYYGAVAVVALACIGVVGLRRSRTGRVLIATRGNPSAVAAFGISAMRAKLTAFAIAGFLCGVAGALLLYQQRGISSATFSTDASLGVFLYSVVGGLGGVAGPLLGFAFEAALTLFSTNPLIVFAGTGLGGVLLLAAAPGGIAQLLYDARDAALRRIAIRLRIDVPALLGRRQADRAPLREPRALAVARVAYDVPRQWAIDARTRQVLP
ncbi:MAG: branched-chain amino acid transport system permease protein livM [Acidimicrobiaceae bacterium]|nr:branched-chain amino acid transport system permease protein livM [Acidimicrobiaceae bacterium]